MSLVAQKFKKNYKAQKTTSKCSHKNEEILSFTPTCFQCDKKGHIKSNCLVNQKKF